MTTPESSVEERSRILYKKWVIIDKRMLWENEQEKKFLRLDDIEDLWTRPEDDGLERILPGLNQRQLKKVKDKMLRFITFLVWIEVDVSWYSSFKDILFNTDPLTEETVKYDDKEMHDRTWTKVELQTRLRLPPQKAGRWHEQYIFMAEEIIFDSRTDSVQTIRANARLPFIRRESRSGHGGYGDVEV